MSEMEILTCKAGHTFERPRQRGRKPTYCPEHISSKDATKPVREAPTASQEVPGRDRIGPNGSAATSPSERRTKNLKPLGGEPVPTQPQPAKRVPAEIAAKKDYRDITLPGITIANLRRVDGVWRCTLICNGERFECLERGGWVLLHSDEEGDHQRHIKVDIAAVIQDKVRALEREADSKTV